MRKAFFAALHEWMKADPRIWFLTGDLGRGLVEPLFESFPDRALNCGVIEPTMIGIAAGLAKTGKLPVVYSIAPFISTRCAEQWKLDVVGHRLKVIGVGVGEGHSYKTAGPSHWTDECADVCHAVGLRVWNAASQSLLDSLGFSIERVLDEALASPSSTFILMP